VFGVVVDAPVLFADGVEVVAEVEAPSATVTTLLPVPAPDDPVYPAALTSAVGDHEAPVLFGEVVLLPVVPVYSPIVGVQVFGFPV
jgi:hypothetical protein